MAKKKHSGGETASIPKPEEKRSEPEKRGEPAFPYGVVDDRPMSPKQLANFLQLSLSTVARLTHRGDIPYFRVGNQIRFIPSQVLQKLTKGDS